MTTPRAAVVAAVILLAVAPQARAQNMIGAWQLDVARSRLGPPLDGDRATLDHRLTLTLSGNALVLDTATSGIPSGAALVFTMRFGTGPQLAIPAPRDHTFVVTLRLECDGEPHAVAVGDDFSTNTYVCRPTADWSGYVLDEELLGIHRITRVSTSPDGETLTIDTTQTHHDPMLRVFTRQH